MKPKGNIYQINDYSVDLSRIKTIRLCKRTTNEKEKRLVEIIYNDRKEFIFDPNENVNELKTINDTIEIFFPDQASASSALKSLEKAWEDYTSRQ